MTPLYSRALVAALGISFAAAARAEGDVYKDKTAPVEARVEDLLGRLTLNEKLSLLGGDRDFYIRPIPRLGIPEIKMADGPQGVRNYGPSTAYPSTVGLAATWDADLRAAIRRLGRQRRPRPGGPHHARPCGQHHAGAPERAQLRVPFGGPLPRGFRSDPDRGRDAGGGWSRYALHEVKAKPIPVYPFYQVDVDVMIGGFRYHDKVAVSDAGISYTKVIGDTQGSFSC